jgi:hypothetical protein
VLVDVSNKHDISAVHDRESKPAQRSQLIGRDADTAVTAPAERGTHKAAVDLASDGLSSMDDRLQTWYRRYVRQHLCTCAAYLPTCQENNRVHGLDMNYGADSPERVVERLMGCILLGNAAV